MQFINSIRLYLLTVLSLVVFTIQTLHSEVILRSTNILSQKSGKTVFTLNGATTVDYLPRGNGSCVIGLLVRVPGESEKQLLCPGYKLIDKKGIEVGIVNDSVYARLMTFDLNKDMKITSYYGYIEGITDEANIDKNSIPEYCLGRFLDSMPAPTVKDLSGFLTRFDFRGPVKQNAGSDSVENYDIYLPLIERFEPVVRIRLVFFGDTLSVIQYKRDMVIGPYNRHVLNSKRDNVFYYSFTRRFKSAEAESKILNYLYNIDNY